MRITEGYTYTFEFKNVETGKISQDDITDYDLKKGNSPLMRAVRKALHLETEWVPYVGYFPNLVSYKMEVRLVGYYY